MKHSLRLVAVALAVFAATACKDKSNTGDQAAESPPTPAPAPPTPVAEATQPPAEPPGPPLLTDERQVMYATDADRPSATFRWQLAGRRADFSLSHTISDGSITATITATVDGVAAQVFQCADLDPAAGGSVEMKATGSNAHIICVNPGHSEDPGRSWGAQLIWDASGTKVVVQGEWEQEDDMGDPETMDIGEDSAGE